MRGCAGNILHHGQSEKMLQPVTRFGKADDAENVPVAPNALA
jgi:hypothetical protein